MLTDKITCPVCQGKGTLTENAKEYEFITRNPITSKCMICNGTGILNPNTKLPNGKRVIEVFRKDELGRVNSERRGKRLNVSRKALSNPEELDIGIGYHTSATTEVTEKSEGRQRENSKKEKKREREMAMNPRLKKVLASGKKFLIVTETEPYYLVVYTLIRNQERKQGTWSWEDEEAYVEALMADRQRMITEITTLKRQNDAINQEVTNG